MSAHLHRGSDLLLFPGLARRRASPARRGPLLALVALIVVAALAIALAGVGAGNRSLRALPEPDRAALLERTVDDLRRFCGDGAPAVVKEHCQELASFAARFDGCTGECEALVRHQLTPVPTR